MTDFTCKWQTSNFPQALQLHSSHNILCPLSTPWITVLESFHMIPTFWICDKNWKSRPNVINSYDFTKKKQNNSIAHLLKCAIVSKWRKIPTLALELKYLFKATSRRKFTNQLFNINAPCAEPCFSSHSEYLPKFSSAICIWRLKPSLHSYVNYLYILLRSLTGSLFLAAPHQTYLRLRKPRVTSVTFSNVQLLSQISSNLGTSPSVSKASLAQPELCIAYVLIPPKYIPSNFGSIAGADTLGGLETPHLFSATSCWYRLNTKAWPSQVRDVITLPVPLPASGSLSSGPSGVGSPTFLGVFRTHWPSKLGSFFSEGEINYSRKYRQPVPNFWAKRSPCKDRATAGFYNVFLLGERVLPTQVLHIFQV